MFHKSQFIDRGQIRSPGFLCLLFVLAALASSYIHFVLYRQSFTGAIIGDVLGNAIGLLLLPVLIVLPWRMYQKKKGAISNQPLIVGLIVFAIVMWSYISSSY